MKLSTFRYDSQTGWSQPFPPQKSDNALLLVFGSTEFMTEPSPLHALRAAYPHAEIVGCSTAGEIHDEFIYDHSLAVALLQLDASRVQVATTTVQRERDATAAGQELITALTAPDLRGVFVLSDGLNVNGSDLIAGINAQLPTGVTVTGGLAGDGPNFQTTWVMHNELIASGMIVAVGFYGEHILLGHGSRGGGIFLGRNVWSPGLKGLFFMNSMANQPWSCTKPTWVNGRLNCLLQPCFSPWRCVANQATRPRLCAQFWLSTKKSSR